MNLAPIILFAFNRPWHTRHTLDALSRNLEAKDSLLYIYCDGAKENTEGENILQIQEVRLLAKAESRFKEVVVKESHKNKGLANSIIEGVTEIINKHGKIIVLEDDIITSPFFLKYMNDGLNTYENSANVYAINSYMFPVNFDKTTTFLSPLATGSWGWGTWTDKWEAFEVLPKYKSIIQNNPLLRARFNFADYNYADMLNNTNSWAIRWYYSVFLRNGLGVFPTKTLSHNIGFGISATHTKSEFAQMNLFNDKVLVEYQEYIDMELHEKLLNYFVKPTDKVEKKRFLERIYRKIFSVLKKLTSV
ncbi:MAG: glycosyltransferase family 2 protein [Bacteroidota bacterium]